MRLIELRVRNFRQHADTVVRFSGGLTGILGANGEGKSTLLEAICWALFGIRATRGSKSEIRWERAPARHVAQVELTFEISGTRYLVDRSESGAALFTEAASAWLPIAESVSGVDARVPELLGMGLQEFQATYLCAQKDLGRLAAMKGGERRTFFLNVMGVGRIVEAQKALRERKSALKQERGGLLVGLGDRRPLSEERDGARDSVDGLEDELSLYRSATESSRMDLAEAEGHLAESLAQKGQHEDLSRTWQLERARVHEIGNDLQRLILRIDSAREAAGRVAEQGVVLAELPALREERERYRNARAKQQTRAEISAQLIALGKKIKHAEWVIADAEVQVARYDRDHHAGVRARSSSLQLQLTALQHERATRQAGSAAARDTAWGEARKTARRIEAIEAAGAEGACPTCARRLGEAFADVLRDLQQEALRLEAVRSAKHAEAQAAGYPTDEEMELSAETDAVLEEMDTLAVVGQDSQLAQANLDRCTRELGEYRTAVNAHSERLAEIPVVEISEEEAGQVMARIHQLETLDRALVADRAVAGREEELRGDEKHRRAAHAAAVQARDDAAAALAVLAFDAENHGRLEAAAAAVRHRHAENATAAARAEAARAAAHERLQRAEAALAEYDRRAAHLHQVEVELRDHEEADQRLSAFRTAQTNSIRPEMEELTSAIVSQLTDGRYESCTITEDFEVILQRHGVDKSVISGGEEDVVAIAQRIAVSQMISERAGHPLSLLILDEPFGSLDEVRRNNILSLIRQLGGIFEQVLVVSHVPEVQEAVDQAILVHFDDMAGRSFVRALMAAEVAA